MTDFAGKRVLITGGMGFIGSNLAIRLTEMQAHVTIVDAMLPDYGGNLFNIAPVRDKITVNFADIRDVNVMNYLVRDQDYIFHLAGQTDHVLSMRDPYPDIDINVKGTAVLMEACRYQNPQAKVVHVGTRGQYSPSTKPPVKEDAPTLPLDTYGISRLAAEGIARAYHENFGVCAVMLRVTNTYGPRAQMKNSHSGVVNWFIRRILGGEAIEVFGDGQLIRDFLYIDDCIEALVRCALTPTAYGQIINLATGIPVTFEQLAKQVIEANGGGSWQYAAFTPERAAQKPDDFYADISRLREILGWEPATPLLEGLRTTIQFYREYRENYW